MRTLIWYHLIGVVQIILFVNIANAQYEGDACNHAANGVSGICKGLDQCPDAIEELKSGIHPQICGYANITPIVCCRSEAIAVMNTTTSNTMLTTTKSPSVQLPIGEKSRLACESYKRLTNKMANFSYLGNQNELIEKCPWDHKSVGVNFKGQVAEEGEFPHMALLGFGSKQVTYDCGGSLISEKYVLTAAHCVVRVSGDLPEIVRLGDLDYADPDDDQHVQVINVKKVIVHPLYNHILKINDISLLELERPAQLSLYVKPICLYRWDPASKVHSGMVTGWGRSDRETNNTRLLKGAIQFFTQEKCSAEYVHQNINAEIQICFGPKEGSTVDTCQGDSGGPIQIYNKDVYCSYYAFGITSFGRGCGISNRPSIYTKLYKYLEWIESIVWP